MTKVCNECVIYLCSYDSKNLSEKESLVIMSNFLNFKISFLKYQRLIYLAVVTDLHFQLNRPDMAANVGDNKYKPCNQPIYSNIYSVAFSIKHI